ncbi:MULTISPECIES: hypothetical protein [unclassified Fibrobacter]|uniref:hypothetical protein n=1 Tax=unclassified Fibrobacter TaxID=2634177 RepID=UPI0009111CD8|nr:MULTISPECIES: hypothetical protein [unclassified Fibrobacter]OWV06409.1 hypothetical protein B7993_05650 [Fibrobacter sp. UWH3]SHL52866.1 conserved hypothetical protein (putative transposase or invertase) [Fibrobacter sp. UWH6]
MTDESIRDYLKYFATDEATTAVTQAIQSKVDFYHKDPKTRSDYMTFKDMLEEERDEGRAEGRVEGANAKAREMAKAMLAEGDSIDKVARCSGLSEEEIKSL